LTPESDKCHEDAVPIRVQAEHDRYALPAAAVANEPSVEGSRQSNPRVRGVLYGCQHLIDFVQTPGCGRKVAVCYLGNVVNQRDKIAVD
jgi:hypothetical protein